MTIFLSITAFMHYKAVIMYCRIRQSIFSGPAGFFKADGAVPMAKGKRTLTS